MPERFPSGNSKEDLQGKVSLEMHSEVMSIGAIFKATGMADITWGERKGVGISLEELQPLEVRQRRRNLAVEMRKRG